MTPKFYVKYTNYGTSINKYSSTYMSDIKYNNFFTKNTLCKLNMLMNLLKKTKQQQYYDLNYNNLLDFIKFSDSSFLLVKDNIFEINFHICNSPIIIHLLTITIKSELTINLYDYSSNPYMNKYLNSPTFRKNMDSYIVDNIINKKLYINELVQKRINIIIENLL